MPDKPIRSGQLIAPFGPGALYTDRKGIPHVVCGLDFWHKREDPVTGITECDKPEEFDRFEPRLANLLGVTRFKTPPDFRQVRKDSTPPVNANLKIPALRFPRWYRHSKTGKLEQFNLSTNRLTQIAGARWYPVRFVSVCSAGHLCEFPWKAWSGCTCAGDGDLYLTDRGGSELSSVTVECKACGAGARGTRSLSSVTVVPRNGETSSLTDRGISCPGDRPWLGDGAEEMCREQLVGALINQTNLYFARTLSSILLPTTQQVDDDTQEIRSAIEALPDLGILKFLWKGNKRNAAVADVSDALAQVGLSPSTEEVHSILESIFSGKVVQGKASEPSEPEEQLLGFRRQEFSILREKLNDPKSRDLRVTPAEVPVALSDWLSRVNLVERLKETRVFYGFDRLEPAGGGLAGMPGKAVGQLFRTTPPAIEQWLPALEVFGEGIYLELKEEAIKQWMDENAAWLNERVSDAFIQRLENRFQILSPLGVAKRPWAYRYLLIHSLAHVLIAQMVFECGYSTASLRERLYVSADPTAPMAGLLIYTAAGDSEGTLGGLVRLGHPKRFAPVFQRALQRAAWCSADPVCSEELGGKGSQLANLAACHACILLPETSCETINHGLDRATLVGMPERRKVGAFSSLLLDVVEVY